MLTAQQNQTLKALALADGTAQDYVNNPSVEKDKLLAAWLNEASTFIVWRTNVTVEVANNVMVWTEIDTLTAGRARIWEWMSKMSKLDASKANIRQGLNDAFSSATATKAALLGIAKRAATRAEGALATGTGTDATPGTMVFEGTISQADASFIRSA